MSLRRMFCGVTALSVIACAIMVHAGIEGSLPAVQVPVVLKPGERLKVTANFGSTHENQISIYNHKDGVRLKEFNNFRVGGGVWISEPNNTGSDQILVVVGLHKDGFDRGDLPWLLSAFKVFTATPKSAYVGWEDGVDQDFNDAVAEIEVIK